MIFWFQKLFVSQKICFKHHQGSQEDRSATPTVDEKESYSNEASKTHTETHQSYAPQAAHHPQHMAERMDPYQQGPNAYSHGPPPRHYDGHYGHPPSK